MITMAEEDVGSAGCSRAGAVATLLPKLGPVAILWFTLSWLIVKPLTDRGQLTVCQYVPSFSWSGSHYILDNFFDLWWVVKEGTRRMALPWGV